MIRENGLQNIIVDLELFRIEQIDSTLRTHGKLVRVVIPSRNFVLHLSAI
jgi:hypothetical protein